MLLSLTISVTSESVKYWDKLPSRCQSMGKIYYYDIAMSNLAMSLLKFRVNNNARIKADGLETLRHRNIWYGRKSTKHPETPGNWRISSSCLSRYNSCFDMATSCSASLHARTMRSALWCIARVKMAGFHAHYFRGTVHRMGDRIWRKLTVRGVKYF